MPGKNDHFKKKIDFSNEFFAFTQTVFIAFVHLAITKIIVKNCESPSKIIVIIIIMIITIIMNNDDDNNIDGDDDNNSNSNNNNDNGNCIDKQRAM